MFLLRVCSDAGGVAVELLELPVGKGEMGTYCPSQTPKKRLLCGEFIGNRSGGTIKQWSS